MHLWGFLVNSMTVIVGSVLGLLLSSRMPDSLKKIILSALGLATILIGAQMALGTEKMIIVIGSLIAGGIIGQLIGIEELLEKFGDGLQKKMKTTSSTFVPGFVTASILFCTGPMTIVGSLQDGFAQIGNLIYIKSIMDGVAAIALSASMGIGVLFSTLTVFTIQGALTLIGVLIGGSLDKIIMNEISATGGALILGLGFNILGIAKIKVGNLLPALIIVGPLVWYFA